MFDVGFSELLVIAVVALLVLGPERLPKAARFAGLWVRRARSQWNSVKAEFERDLADDELRRTLRDTQASLRDARESLRDAGSSLRRDFESASEELMRGPMPSTGTPHPDALPPVAPPEAIAAVTLPPPSVDDGSLPAQLPGFDPDPEQSMHAPMDEPPPPSDAEEEGEHDAPQR
jgi:sec-independent protein translocase protein TatB